MCRFFLFYLLSFTALCQQTYRAGTTTQFNVNYKVGKALKLNTKFESRQILSQKEMDKSPNHRFQYERTDLTLLLTTKLSINNIIGGGYMIRLEDNTYYHRIIQQFNNVRKFEWFSVAHRVLADETFTNHGLSNFRISYRIGIQKPLNGQYIDPKEFYAKVNNDFLGTWSRDESDFEIGILPTLGYTATANNKIELGVDYRVNELRKDSITQQFWVTLGWFISI
ncbi:DUF2490 domain-containing protein [Dyadobacter sp. CY107]|uniref:DUF2490 domain-containing protein n=1 Tax=Dyadobacter fanqingshengii TaxID=2906443 RepID=UPI001F3A1D04|nr:DUF2490 domain-containing protein [Dyadobacter fanqingshengii]MCF2502171.1 DUF2490 domain-containing protein [Dyadobacter fanqingshengii]